MHTKSYITSRHQNSFCRAYPRSDLWKYLIANKREDSSCYCSLSWNYFVLLSSSFCVLNTFFLSVITADGPCSGVVCSSDRHCNVRPNGRPICVCNDEQC